MPTLEADAQALLDSYDPLRPAFFAFFDFVDDPIRVTTAGFNVTFEGAGDPDLDGHTFSAVDPSVIDVGEVANREGGSETLVCMLSGILGLDSDTLDLVGDRSRWQGRLVRLWMVLRDQNGTQQGGVVPFHTGFASSIEILPSPETQTIKMEVEHYLASLASASNRTYLSQSRYDAADQSARATIGSANAAKAGPGSGTVAGAGGDGVSIGDGRRFLPWSMEP